MIERKNVYQLFQIYREGRIIELLYEEAREHVIKGRYPCGSARAVALGALQARIQLGPYDPLIHTTHFFR